MIHKFTLHLNSLAVASYLECLFFSLCLCNYLKMEMHNFFILFLYVAKIVTNSTCSIYYEDKIYQSQIIRNVRKETIQEER